MINVQQIYREFLRTKNVVAGGAYPFGRVLRNSGASVAIMPVHAPDTVLKIVYPFASPFGLPPQREYEELKRLEGLGGGRYILPKGLSTGCGPDHVHMTHIGPSCDKLFMKIEETLRVARVAGGFQADLYNNHGLLHGDLREGNITRPADGTVGIVDLASVAPAKHPEHMFIMPLLFSSPVFCEGLAQGFERGIGEKLSFKRITRTVEKMRARPQDRAVIERNLNRWKDMRKTGDLLAQYVFH